MSPQERQRTRKAKRGFTFTKTLRTDAQRKTQQGEHIKSDFQSRKRQEKINLKAAESISGALSEFNLWIRTDDRHTETAETWTSPQNPSEHGYATTDNGKVFRRLETGNYPPRL